MYGLRATQTIPEPQPLDMAIVKRHLGRRDDDDDAYILELVRAAMLAAEAATHRQILTASWELVLDRFPWAGATPQPTSWPMFGRPIRLPRPPWQTTNYVKYHDGGSGTLQTWDAANYMTVAKEPAEIWPAYGKTWPWARVMPGAVLVGFDSGYGADWQSVPTLLKHGMLLLVGHWYLNREAVVVGPQPYELPLGVKNIFDQCAVGDDFDDYQPGTAGAMEAAGGCSYAMW